MNNLLAQATEYLLLEPLPGITKPDGVTATFATYIPGIFSLMIGIAGLLAVIMIVYGGLQYLTTEAFQGKGDAKETIKNALWGLLLTIASWLILNTVSPNLVKFDLNIDPQDIQGNLTPVDFNNLPPAEQLEILKTDKEKIGCPECLEVRTGPLPPVGTAYPFNNVPFPSKAPSANGCKGTQLCYVHKDLYKKIIDLATELNGETTAGIITTPPITWQVTEMLPQTTGHASSCHKANAPDAGKCVDASIDTSHNQRMAPHCKERATLNRFLIAVATKVGSNFQYEVPEQQCLDYYRGTPGMEQGIKNRLEKVNPGTREHVHINL